MGVVEETALGGRIVVFPVQLDVGKRGIPPCGAVYVEVLPGNA